jgi:hypothetical protein
MPISCVYRVYLPRCPSRHFRLSSHPNKSQHLLPGQGGGKSDHQSQSQSPQYHHRYRTSSNISTTETIKPRREGGREEGHSNPLRSGRAIDVSTQTEKKELLRKRHCLFKVAGKRQASASTSTSTSTRILDTNSATSRSWKRHYLIAVLLHFPHPISTD